MVKKAQDARPNQQLKQARELRGWSQSNVAQQLGVDHYYLSRWERGLTVPSPYYRQQLCLIFGKNADELGLLPRVARTSQSGMRSEQESGAEETESRQIYAKGASEEAVRDPAMPLLFALATGLVGRDRLLAQLKAQLCSGRQGVVAALSGLPGVGKTTLATALAQDTEVREHFRDGVLWAGLGPSPDVPGLLSRWGALLGISSAQAARLNSSEEWIRALRIVIGDRRLLLVIDDAWRIEAALAFKVGGLRCAYLLTTRFPPLALQFAPQENAVHVGELAEAEGIELLKQLAPELVRAEPESTRLLVQAVGGLPLALTISGSYLRSQAYSQQPRRMRAALTRLQEAQERLLLTRPSALGERGPGLPADVPVSLQTIIAVSEQQVSESARQALRALAIFPPKPNTFAEEAAVAVSGVEVEALDELSDAGLLETSEPGRYTLHQVLADYARLHLADSEVPLRLVSYMTEYVTTHIRAYEQLEQESSNIVAALRVAAGQTTEITALVRCTAAFSPFLQSRGLYTLAEEFLFQAERAARSLLDQVGLAAIIYHLGRVQLYRGKYPEAEECFQEALQLARQVDDQELICQSLSWLGVLARYRGDYQQAKKVYAEGLALARKLENAVQICALLLGIGGAATEQGDYQQAEHYLDEGILLARQSEDRAQLCALLVNRGQAAYYQGDYPRVEHYTLEALQIARQIGYLSVEMIALGNLGATSEEQKRYVEAETYGQAALQLARQLENPVQIGYNLANLGEIALKQGDEEQAVDYLQQALTQARSLSMHALLRDVLVVWGELQLRQKQPELAEATFQELIMLAADGAPASRATACYGLARVALVRGQRDEAYALGKESIQVFSSIGNGKAAQVEAWFVEEKLNLM